MIYLDNAATSYPKPPSVIKAMRNYMQNIGANYGRGGYKTATDSIDMLYSVREKISKLINCRYPEQIVFTKNATEALNIAIIGTIHRGDYVITSPYEHNSVVRPLMQQKCVIHELPLDINGCCDVKKLTPELLKKASLVVINHSSNVSGVVSDIEYAAKICAENNVPMLADASQSAGVLPIDADKLSCMIAFAGHKGLLGPQGTGCLYIPKNYTVRPLITGGTGSNSHLLTQPEIMPDKFESGTLNMPALCGLFAACEFVENHFGEIYTYEHFLCSKLIDGLLNIKNIHVLCPNNSLRTSAVSFYSDKEDTNQFGSILDGDFNIAVRCGLHCTPTAHKAYGTFESGTVRVSAGFFNKQSDTDKFLHAVNRIQNSK